VQTPLGRRLTTLAATGLALAAPAWLAPPTAAGGSGASTADATTAEAAAAPDLRLLSSPDFLNADVGDLSRGPNSWSPRRSENGTNGSHERVLGRILDDWASKDPAAVLVAGDLVNGRWGQDDRRTGNFGPVRTFEERRAALRSAAATYYPQWLQRFRDRGLDVYPAIGDHEYGDNDWPRDKRRLAPTFAHEFSRYFTRAASGSPRFPDRPTGPHAMTAYAWRPSPDVQVVSIDVFDITKKGAHIRLDAAQMRWLKGVLKQAQRDGVTWTVVQGHTPILMPVRSKASSRLHYEGGRGSDIWKVFTRFGVDVYLCGEVHAVTGTVKDDILQLAHGGAFQFGLTNYALLDFRGDRLDVTLNDYRLHVRDGQDGRRLWETARAGMKKVASLDGGAFTIGTLTFSSSGRVSNRSGILSPYRG
jgi:hypothetical protein